MAKQIKNPKLHDTEYLRRAYLKEGRSCASIAAEINASPMGVRHALLRADIKTRPRGSKAPKSTTTAKRQARPPKPAGRKATPKRAKEEVGP